MFLTFKYGLYNKVKHVIVILWDEIIISFLYCFSSFVSILKGAEIKTDTARDLESFF
jgi:hypothetical protein